ncbi:MAG: glycosyltransferase family 4 protein [Chthoniobacterales bacterium]
MKITIVLGAFFPVPPVMGGAVEKQWFALAKEFANRGHDVVQISRAIPQFPPSGVIDGVRHRRIRGYDSPRSLLWLKFLDLLYSLRARKVLPNADVLVTNTFWLPILRPPRSRGQIYVHVARMPKGQMRFYKNAARLQAVSQSVAQAIRDEAPAVASRVSVVPYASPAGLGDDDVPPLSAREKILLYVGRVHPEKGLGLLLDAVPQLQGRGWRLLIVGAADEAHGGGGREYLEQLQRHASAAQIGIEWVGGVFDEAELAEYYRRARIFIYPSLAERGETFGVAPLEAMTNGCAVVVSQLACFTDFIEAERNALVFDHRAIDPVKALADQLQRLINDESLAARLALAATERSRQFSVSEIAARYLRDFEQVLAKCS